MLHEILIKKFLYVNNIQTVWQRYLESSGYVV